jgi:flagellar biosynthesis protein FlhF
MRLKSFFANTIEEAIRQARVELGPDAMLVNSKQTGPEGRHLGAYEVVACADSLGGASPAKTRREPEGSHPSKANRGSASIDHLAHEISGLKQQMDHLALALARSGSAGTFAFDAELARAFTTLADAELDTEVTYDILSRVRAADLPQSLRTELAKLAIIDSELGRSAAPRGVVALVGPPGAGKTSALVKLAVQYGVAARKLVQIISTDTYRIGAAEELRSYAAILGIGFQVVETPAALGPALDECRHKEFVLIDTPGLSRSEIEASQEWANVLASHAEIDTHLVLPASMRSVDLRRVAAQYDLFKTRKLLFTRLDETETLGPLLCLSVRTGKPISFFCAGQRIPEDLSPAKADTILDSILGHPTEQERFAAPQSKSEPKYEVVAA